MISLRDLNEGIKNCNVLLICPICGSEIMLENPYRKKGRVQKGYFTDIQDFVENVKQVGFDIISIDDASYVLVEAIKR